ncbi:hypothetical protein C4K18_4753 [Pseudomonas chlororaphis subsp. aurantiaca]|nr:hypothetical protein C4K18_4753 [Pseudomonas chlororaphis subsp. aurantiaca]
MFSFTRSALLAVLLSLGAACGAFAEEGARMD